jgi:hypothetical protein
MLLTAVPEASFLLNLLIAVNFLASLMAVLLGVFNQRRIQKREVTFSPDYQPRGDYVLRTEWKGLDAKLDQISASNEARAEKIHVRVNQVLESVSELRGEVRAARDWNAHREE